MRYTIAVTGHYTAHGEYEIDAPTREEAINEAVRRYEDEDHSQDYVDTDAVVVREPLATG